MIAINSKNDENIFETKYGGLKGQGELKPLNGSSVEISTSFLNSKTKYGWNKLKN